MLSCSVMSDFLWPMHCSPPCSFIHRIFQTRILEWVAIFYFKEPFQPRDENLISCVSCMGRWILYSCITWESQSITFTDYIILHHIVFFKTFPYKDIIRVLNIVTIKDYIRFSSVQLFSCVQFFATPWMTALQTSMSIINSRSLLKLIDRVGEDIQPSYPLSSSSPPAFNLPSIRTF